MIKRGFFLLISILLSFSTFGQYFQTGQDPASIKWRQINTKNFQLIYPSDFEQKAQKMANILEKVYLYGSYSLNHKPKKISVIFHTQTVKSNGLLAWAPRRVEMYTTPHQSIYPQGWLEQLAVHEFRHVVQVDKIANDLPQVIPFLFAQQGAALVTGAYLPFWFLEGDAVVTETALSKTGRGRFPSFLMENQAQVVEKGIYSFDKAYLGSYKDYVPNHYKMGYYLVGGARNLYGSAIWENVVTNIGKKPFSLTPTNSSLKKQIGLTQKKLYHQVFDSLRTEWLDADKGVAKILAKEISKPLGDFSSYKYNFFTKENTILSYHSSLNSVSKFIKIDKAGNEEKIYTPGTIFNESVDFTENMLVWSEQIPDLRWNHSGTSLINILNINNNKVQELKPEFKSFSPSLSRDKKSIAIVEVDFQNNYYLSVYDINSKQLLIRFQTPDNNYLFTPKWLNDEQLVTVILTEKGKTLALINPFKKEVKVIAREWLGEIKHPVVNGDEIYFISSYSGKNDLYVLTLNDNNIYKVYESRFGVEYPTISPLNDKIVLSDYTANGFRLIEILKERKSWKPISEVAKGVYPLADKLASQEPGVLDFSDSNLIKHKSKKYNKLSNLLHFHSWAPASIDVNSYDIKPGVSILSQNKLGTAETTLGYKWDVSEKTGKAYARFVYKGWYPELAMEVNSGKRASEYLSITNYTNEQNEIVKSDTINKRFTWAETTLELDAKIPINLSKGKYFRFFQPEIKYELTSRQKDHTTPDGFVVGNIHALIYRFYYHQILRKSYQDLVPNFGFILDFNYRHTPGSVTNLGNLSSLQMINYLPGILPNHGIVLYNGYQKRNSNNGHMLSDVIRYPRGWGKINNTDMYSFAADYKLPLLYPDWNLGRLVYLKRLKASLFADYAWQRGNYYNQGQVSGNFTQAISTIGAEITGDMHFLRFFAPVNMGLRVGYLTEPKQMHYTLLLSIDFTSF